MVAADAAGQTAESPPFPGPFGGCAGARASAGEWREGASAKTRGESHRGPYRDPLRRGQCLSGQGLPPQVLELHRRGRGGQRPRRYQRHLRPRRGQRLPRQVARRHARREYAAASRHGGQAVSRTFTTPLGSALLSGAIHISGSLWKGFISPGRRSRARRSGISRTQTGRLTSW